jgi:predicted component of viral defense system (DUF524 family)
MSMKVNIDNKEQTVIACDQCEYVCRLNIQMKNHLNAKHQAIPKYSCKECKFTTEFIADSWKHTFNQHPDNSVEFNPKQTENMILKIVTEQNSEKIEEMETLKKDLKAGFVELVNVIEASIGKLKDDTNEKCKTLADTVIKLYGSLQTWKTHQECCCS